MPTTLPRRVVVVLGSGRSGTSLLMQVLRNLGMALSEQMIEARRDNPEGFFEDTGIVRIHVDLLKSLHAWPYFPLPADWENAPATAAAQQQLHAVLRQRLAGNAAIWGFKDPRSAAFLPLWQRLFAAEQLAPAYVLALRDPGSIIASFLRAYDTPPETAELVWLQRTCDALHHTAAACCIVHYEDWFTHADALAAEVARHTGLAHPVAVQDIIKPDLNRARHSAYILRNEHAQRLDAALKSCRGSEFERGPLLQTVAACRAALAQHPAWKAGAGGHSDIGQR